MGKLICISHPLNRHINGHAELGSLNQHPTHSHSNFQELRHATTPSHPTTGMRLLSLLAMRRPLTVGLITLILLGLQASADKDDSYYVAGTGNPNVNEAMYWKDAENVLQDLSKFSTLYVKYHHCAWSWNQKEPDEDGDVDENDYWYMGKIPPMGANVAFSLYGQLKSHSGSFKGCDQNSFINSFYTRKGFTAFSDAMQAAGVSGFSSYDSSSMSAECQGGSGVGCDPSGGFAVHTYSSSLCDPEAVTATTNQLSNLNKAMESVQCIKIYDTYRSYSSYSSSSSSNDDGGDDGVSYDGTPLALLDYSSACFYQNVFSPDGDCPDPFGKIAYYKANFYKDIQKSKSQRPVSVYKQKMVYQEKIHNSQAKSAVGIGFLAIAGVILLVDKIIFDHIFPKPRKGLKASDYPDEEDQAAATVKSSPSDADDRRLM